MHVLAIADDVSGAAEVASVLGATIALDRPRGGTVVVDLNTRGRPPRDAARAVRHVVEGERRIVFKKVDSLLRGNVAAEVEALGDDVVFAPALPVEGRTVRGGVLHVHGVPLHRTDAWHAEVAAPPRTIAELLPGVAIRDADTDADLDAIVAEALGRGARLAGSAGLAAALGRHLGVSPLPDTAPAGGRGPLVVVGTAAPVAAEQVQLLAAAGIPILDLDDGAPDLTAGPAVLRLSERFGPALIARLADTVAAVAGDVDLVLTGGETARHVLDALGVRSLVPVAVIHHGAVQSRTPDGRTVVTRPGSFGGPDSLLQIVRALS